VWLPHMASIWLPNMASYMASYMASSYGFLTWQEHVLLVQLPLDAAAYLNT